MGRIGREVARMARAFEMPVHYRDQARLPADLEQGRSFTTATKVFLRNVKYCPSTRRAARPPIIGSTPSASDCYRMAPSS